MKTTLLIPILNEITGMKEIFSRIQKEWVDQILVVDGGSTDGSLEFARSFGFDVIVQKEKGIRYAYREVWPLIAGDFVVTFSPDGNCIPEVIPLLIEKVKQGYDMVIASRYLGEAKSSDDDALTGFGNWFFTRLINRAFKASYTDALGIFRIYRKNLFWDLAIGDGRYYWPEQWMRTSAGVEPLISILAAKRKLKIVEIPASEPKRVGGVRKVRPIRWGIVFFLQILRESIRCT